METKSPKSLGDFSKISHVFSKPNALLWVQMGAILGLVVFDARQAFIFSWLGIFSGIGGVVLFCSAAAVALNAIVTYFWVSRFGFPGVLYALATNDLLRVMFMGMFIYHLSPLSLAELFYPLLDVLIIASTLICFATSLLFIQSAQAYRKSSVGSSIVAVTILGAVYYSLISFVGGPAHF